MKWIYRIVSILIAPALLLAIFGILSAHNTDRLERLYWDNDEEFCELTETLLRISRRNGNVRDTYITEGNYEDESFVQQIGDLRFYTEYAPYPQVDYADMHTASAEFVSSLDIFGIEIRSDWVDFFVSENYLYAFHIIYIADGEPLDIEATWIKEATVLREGWYALVVYT